MNAKCNFAYAEETNPMILRMILKIHCKVPKNTMKLGLHR